MINRPVMTAEEAARIQDALANVDAVMLGYMLRMRAGLAGATSGAVTAGAGIRGLGEVFAALKRAEPEQETTP